MTFTEAEHLQYTHDLLSCIGTQESERLFSYPECEVDNSFVAFLESYWDLQEIPSDFTIIDLGCYQAFQGALFQSHHQYIGVDVAVDVKWRLLQSNAVYYDCSIQQFIQDILPHLNLDLSRTFAVCSYVPDKQAREMVRNTFPFYRDRYCSELNERLPDSRNHENTLLLP